MTQSLKHLVTLTSFWTLLGCQGQPESSLETSLPKAGITIGDMVLQDDISSLSIATLFTSNGNRCTGVVVGEDLVLTAGHCVPEKNHSIYVSFGKNRTESYGEDSDPLRATKVTHSRVHPKYIATKDAISSADRRGSDLAVLKLETKVPAFVVIQALPKAQLVFKMEDQFEMIGVGLLSAVDENPEHQLFRKFSSAQNVIPFIVNARRNGDTYETRYGKTILFQQKDGGVCSGDSGGPLFLHVEGKEPQLIGIASGVAPGQKSENNEFCKAYSIFTDLRKNLGWIKTSMEELSQPSTEK